MWKRASLTRATMGTNRTSARRTPITEFSLHVATFLGGPICSTTGHCLRIPKLRRNNPRALNMCQQQVYNCEDYRGRGEHRIPALRTQLRYSINPMLLWMIHIWFFVVARFHRNCGKSLCWRRLTIGRPKRLRTHFIPEPRWYSALQGNAISPTAPQDFPIR